MRRNGGSGLTNISPEKTALLNKWFAHLKAIMVEQHKKDYREFVDIYGESEAGECLYTKDGHYNPKCKTRIVVI